MSTSPLLTSLQQWWSARAPRERGYLTAATVLLVVAVMYAVAIAPAWRVLGTHPQNHARLQSDWQTLVQLQAQAKALQAQPRQNAAAAQAALQSASVTLGAQADISFGPEGARVVLRNVDGHSLAQWLAAARTQAGSVPLQASISRNGAAWSGTVLMSLPAP